MIRRDVDNDSTTDYSPTYDAVGNLTDAKADYKYTYDPLGRLVSVTSVVGSSLLAEYRYVRYTPADVSVTRRQKLDEKAGSTCSRNASHAG